MIKLDEDLLLTIKTYAKDFLLILLGIISASFGLKGFLLPNQFTDGGATGISLLISVLTDFPLSILILSVNLPFIFMAYYQIGKEFTIKTIIAICGLSLCLALSKFPVITNDNLLVAIFGGFFLGAGIGLSIRGGAVIDGTEVLAIFLSKKTGATLGDIIFIINVIIFSIASYFLGIEIALYSMLTYLSASKALDFVVDGIEEYNGVTIVSQYSEEIRLMIIKEMGRGVTVYHGKSGYGKKGQTSETEILFTIVTRLELAKLNLEIEKIDPEAFVVMNSIKNTKGGMIKKRRFKH
jgi:uncharacterized membrane-anchored protein YitT (DUF2179 family)